MTYRVPISVLVMHSKPHISNFFRCLLQQQPYAVLNEETVNLALKEYNAVYGEYAYGLGAHIDFNSKEDYILFLLRHS